MSQIQYSQLLAELIDNAKKLGNRPNQPLTAERFLLALIQLIETPKTAKPTLEYSFLERRVMRKIRDFAQAKTVLGEYIENDRTSIIVDELYMKKIMQEAMKQADRSDRTQLDARVPFMCICDNPSPVIKKLLVSELTHEQQEPDEKPAEEPTAQKLFWELDDDDDDDDHDDDDHEDDDDGNGMDALVADVKRIRSHLQSVVFGQDNAVNTFATGYFQARLRAMIDKSKRAPAATFLFAGPPGVGKTFLAEQAAEALKLPFKRFDMSEYSDKEANIEFCGSDKVYKNGKAGNVTSFVGENPECVLLFDEIEKAHLNVIHLFLQVLDAGRLRDNYTDHEVSFSRAIIIFTTNAGKQLYEEHEGGDLSGVSKKVLIQALQRDINPVTGAPYFPGAICSRFASGNVVMFNHIGAHNLRTIAKREIQRYVCNLQESTGIKFDIDERVYTALLFAEGSAADARTVKGRASSFFNNELYELLRLVASEKTKTGISDIEQIRICMDLSRAKTEIVEMFEPAQNPRILVFADRDKVEQCQLKAPNCDLLGAQTLEQGLKLLQSNDINFVLLDPRCGAVETSLENLNLEDVESPARDFFKFLVEQKKDLPIYLMEYPSSIISAEEKVSFMGQGVRDVIRVTGLKAALEEQLEQVADGLYQQASMEKLAKGNKLITFATAQSVTENGKNAQIKLYDFEMGTAVDAEDAQNILSTVSTPKVRFDDVIGAREAKKELTYFVEYLKDPKKYMGTGVKAPKGVLLYGPPGTGKTMLAKAMAKEAGVTFIAAEGNQFLAKYVGEGSQKVHQLFRTARKYAPSILFIDEIDAVGKERRGGLMAGGGGEETLTAFLTEMDGFVTDPSKPVFVLAATNFDVEPGGSKSLDPALTRRFDRRVYIDLPDKADRIRFLKMVMEKNKALVLSQDQIENIALRSTGMSLAELDSVVELALRSAIREGSTKVTDAIFEEAFETFNNGEVKKWDVAQLERVARHEAGHAFLSWHSGKTPSYLTIVARGNHGGYMQHAEQEGKAVFTKQELLARIRTSLGGRAAEIAYYGMEDGISTGASGDLATATAIAQRIVCAYGMDESFGLAVVHDSAAINGIMTAEVRAAVNRILNEQMAEAVRIITEQKPRMDALVEALLSKNHMNLAQIEQVLSLGQKADGAE